MTERACDPDTGEPYVVGQLKVPFWRGLGCKLAAPMMRLGVPGARRLFWRCLLGPGVSFEAGSIEAAPENSPTNGEPRP